MQLFAHFIRQVKNINILVFPNVLEILKQVADHTDSIDE